MKEEQDYYSVQRKFWKLLAPVYDLMAAPASSIRHKVVDFADAPQGSKILDVATGTGKQAFAFAKRGYNVTGVDLSEDMLKIAVRKNRYSNLRLRNADAARLPFKDARFDVSCISFALHEMPVAVRERVLLEMVRVTKPDGTILIVDFDLPANKLGRFFIYNACRLFEGSHYVRYIKSPLRASLTKSGIAINGELRIICGGGRIFKGSPSA